jgi:hypothetical protein
VTVLNGVAHLNLHMLSIVKRAGDINVHSICQGQGLFEHICVQEATWVDKHCQEKGGQLRHFILVLNLTQIQYRFCAFHASIPRNYNVNGQLWEVLSRPDHFLQSRFKASTCPSTRDEFTNEKDR